MELDNIWLLNVVYQFEYYIFFVCYFLRTSKNKNTGKNNISGPRPKPYKWKVGISILMIFINLSMIIDLKQGEF
jgi:hypothetical protein